MLLYDYIPILLMAALAAGFAAANLVVSCVFGPRVHNPAKLDPYECGMPPVGNPRERFNIKYFIVAMLFVIFDIEIVFLFLWAVVFRELGWYGIGVMSVFLGLLIATLFYELKKGALEWASKPN